MVENLVIFDTTLRDGEQTPGVYFDARGKLIVALQLQNINVDVIELGFAASSPSDFYSITRTAPTLKRTVCCSLARAIKDDICLASRALRSAKRHRIHTFIATSDIHIKKKLKLTNLLVFKKAKQAVRLGSYLTDDVEFSPEDGSRSDGKFLAATLSRSIREGARVINITDTVGYAVPELFGNSVHYLKETIHNSDLATFSAHCHNDLGLAAANTISAIKLGGVKQVECSVNGLGERAGNAALEELVMILKTRRDYFSCSTQIKTQLLLALSQTVSRITGSLLSLVKPVVGQNAFAHASGIHQDGVIKHRNTYEIMKAEDVGWGKSRIVLNKMSGSSGFKDHLKTLGITLSEREMGEVFPRFKILAGARKTVSDGELLQFISAIKARTLSP